MGKSCALWGERCPLAVGRRLGEVETKFAWRLLLRGRKCAVGHNGELWGTVGRCGVSPDPAPPRLYGAQLGPIGGITGKFGAGIWDIGLGFGTKV